MNLMTRIAYLFAFVSFSALIACGDSTSTSADEVESSSSEPEKVIESSSSESSSSSLSSSSEEKIESSSSSEDEEEPVIEEKHPWPSDSLIAVLGGDYFPALIADVDFSFERVEEEFPYVIHTGYEEATEFGYMEDSLKAAQFEEVTNSYYYGTYLGKYVDHKLVFAAYGGIRGFAFKYYDVSATDFPAEAFSAKNEKAELPKIENVDGFYFDSLKNFLIVAGTEEKFGETFRDSLKALGFTAKNDTIFEKTDVEKKYVLSVKIIDLSVGDAYELKFEYKDISNYAYFKMPENLKVTYREVSSGIYVQQNTFYRDGMDYYYTTSLKYSSPISFESNSSYSYKYDEASGSWLMYEGERVRDSLSVLEFMRSIVGYAGLNGYWNIFDIDLGDYVDQGVVNYNVTTNLSNLECHKWTLDKYGKTTEKIVCSADGIDYLLSSRDVESSKSSGISELVIGGVEIPAK